MGNTVPSSSTQSSFPEAIEVEFDDSSSSESSSVATSAIPPLSTERTGHSLVLLDDHIYCLGGNDLVFYSRSVERLKISSNDFDCTSNNDSTCNSTNKNKSLLSFSEQWEQFPEMIEGRSNFAASVIDDIIYVFGGKNNSGAVDKIQVPSSSSSSWYLYSPEWERIQNTTMITPRYDHAAAVVGNQIYILGGRDNSSWKILDSVEVFDQTSESFVPGPRMPIALANMAAVVVGKYIAVIGGCNNFDYGDDDDDDDDEEETVNQMLLLNTESHEWITIKLNNTPKVPRSFHIAGVLSSKTIVVYGGKDMNGLNSLNTIESISFRDLAGFTLDEKDIEATIKIETARKLAEEQQLVAEAARKDEELAAEAAIRDQEERLAAKAAKKKAEEERLALEAERKAEEERLAAEAAKKAEEERLTAELRRLTLEAAKKKAEVERLTLEVAEKKAEVEQLSAKAAEKINEKEWGKICHEIVEDYYDEDEVSEGKECFGFCNIIKRISSKVSTSPAKVKVTLPRPKRNPIE